ncbi:hypothetical protein C1H46_009872 [Malus baccata]|uniref:Uncharacterized protein n=1 Tax=Malus baccata TaxID=106549 RepID=A0A540N0I4_MALBA|nr:hypothetical protein C1H46_009872 [Malus baccata]
MATIGECDWPSVAVVASWWWSDKGEKMEKADVGCLDCLCIILKLSIVLLILVCQNFGLEFEVKNCLRD